MIAAPSLGAALLSWAASWDGKLDILFLLCLMAALVFEIHILIEIKRVLHNFSNEKKGG